MTSIRFLSLTVVNVWNAVPINVVLAGNVVKRSKADLNSDITKILLMMFVQKFEKHEAEVKLQLVIVSLKINSKCAQLRQNLAPVFYSVFTTRFSSTI